MDLLILIIALVVLMTISTLVVKIIYSIFFNDYAGNLPSPEFVAGCIVGAIFVIWVINS